MLRNWNLDILFLIRVQMTKQQEHHGKREVNRFTLKYWQVYLFHVEKQLILSRPVFEESLRQYQNFSDFASIILYSIQA